MTRFGCLVWLVLAGAGLACAPTAPGAPAEPEPPPPPPACPSGQGAGPYGCVLTVADRCDPGQRPELGRPDCVSVGVTVCAAGFEPRTDGWGCQPIAATDCGPGTRAELGRPDCVLTGWLDCPAGFRVPGDGWGCEAIRPSACGRGSFSMLGQAECQPLGDCSGPFPPSNATRYVDPSFSDGQLDATHHRGLAEALQAASALEVIAVEGGDYAAEGLRLDRPLSVIGRCAAQVRLHGTATAPGLTINSAGVRLQGLSLEHHRPGILVGGGGVLYAQDLEIMAPVTAGLIVLGEQSQLWLSNSKVQSAGAYGQNPGVGVQVQRGGRAGLSSVEVMGSQGYGLVVLDPGSVLTATRAVLRDATNLGDAGGEGLLVGAGAQASLVESVIQGTARGGVLVSGGQAVLRGLELLDVGTPSASDAAGINVNHGGQAWVEGARLAGTSLLGAGVFDAGATLSLRSTVIVDGRPGGNGLTLGAILQGEAELLIEDSAIVGQGSAAVAQLGGELRLARARFGGGPNDGSALLVDGGGQVTGQFLELIGPPAGTFGVNLRGPGTHGELRDSILQRSPHAVFDGASLVLDRCAVLDSWDVGFFLGSTQAGVAAGSQLLLRDSVGARNRAGTDPGGGGAILVADQSRAELVACTLADNGGQGAYVEAGSTLTVTDSVVRDTQRASDGKKGMGLEVWGELRLERSALLQNQGGGLVLQGPARGAVEGTLFANNRLLGAYASASSALTVQHSALVDQQPVEAPSESERFGFGALIGGDSTFVATLFRNNRYAGLAFDATGRPEAVTIVEDSVISDTQSDGTAFGHGIIVGTGTLRVGHSYVLNNARVGIAFSAATGRIASTLIAGNGVGAHAQNGTTLREGDASAEPVPLEALFTDGTLFLDNGSKVGIGQIPLPGANPDLGPPPDPRDGT